VQWVLLPAWTAFPKARQLRAIQAASEALEAGELEQALRAYQEAEAAAAALTAEQERERERERPGGGAVEAAAGGSRSSSTDAEQAMRLQVALQRAATLHMLGRPLSPAERTAALPGMAPRQAQAAVAEVVAQLCEQSEAAREACVAPVRAELLKAEGNAAVRRREWCDINALMGSNG
jgi:hypothetical protein